MPETKNILNLQQKYFISIPIKQKEAGKLCITAKPADTSLED